MTLGEVATRALPILEKLKPNPLDASSDVFVGIAQIIEALEPFDRKDLANKLTVLMIAVAPVPDHAARPEKFGVFAAWLVTEVEADFRRFLE